MIKDGVALLKAAQKLDEEALTTIFDEFAPAIYKYTLRLCHDQIGRASCRERVYSSV